MIGQTVSHQRILKMLSRWEDGFRHRAENARFAAHKPRGWDFALVGGEIASRVVAAGTHDLKVTHTPPAE